MKPKHTTRTQLRLQNLLFLVLFLTIIGVSAWLSTRYHFQADWTANSRNTLSEASVALLEKMPDPLTIDAFVREGNMLRPAIKEVIERYQRSKPDITLRFINPDTAPDQVREQGITMDGELVIHYQGKRENLADHSEQAITNTLQRLARADERWLVFLEGHGERNPQGQANHDLGQWGAQLSQKGFQLHRVNLAATPQLPENTSVLVIADPQTPLLDGEIALIQRYIEQGGNLLWLLDPGSETRLPALAQQLGITLQPGLIVDPTTQALGISDPRFVLVADYPPHVITRGLESITLFPQAGGILAEPGEGWSVQSLLESMPRSWRELDEIVDHVSFDEQDEAGPIRFGVTLTREPETQEGEQRIVVIGDGDFLANSYLGNGGNLDLGMNIINWLSHDDSFIDIPSKSSPDRSLELSSTTQGVIGFGFLLGIPGGLLLAGLLIWLKRRKR